MNHSDLIVSAPPVDTTASRHVAIYLRVSTDEQDVDHQRAACYSTAAREFSGVATVEYVDPGVSASKTPLRSRPHASRMMEAIEEGVVVGVVTWDQDRLSRGAEVAELALFLDLCKRHSVRVFDPRGEIHQDDMAARIITTLREAMAEDESSKKGERARSGQMALARAGKWPKGPTPRGYDRDAETKQLVPNATAFLITEAFERFAAGVSRNKLARWLTDTTAVTWERWHVKDMLRNPAYVGVIEHGGERHPGLHQPLVSEELFERVQDHLIETKGFDMRENRRSPFGAMLRCGCGGQLHYHAETRLGHANYECRDGCRLRLHAESIEFVYMLTMGGIGSYLSERLSDPEWRTDDDTGEEQALRAEYDDLTTQRANLLGLVARGDAMAEKLADDLRHRAEAIERTVRRLTASWESKREQLAGMAKAWDGFDWSAASVEERRLRVTTSTESLRIEMHEDEDWQAPLGAMAPTLIVRPRGFPESIGSPVSHQRRGEAQRHLRNMGVGVGAARPS